MARGSSRTSSKPAPARHAPAPAPAARQAPPPAAAPHHPPAHQSAPAPAPMMAPPQQSGGGGLLGGLGRTMAEGFAFGTGSAIARNVVNNVMGGGSSAPAPAAAPAPAPVQQAPTMPSAPKGCETDHAEFMRCLQENASNAGNCDFYFNALQQCQARSF